MSKYDDLVAKLREIFQIDRPELDFGVYRILNARTDEIDHYLSTRLKQRVAEALAVGSAANVEGQKRELEETIKNLQAAGVDPETAPKVKELRAAIGAASAGASEHEDAVFSHLLTFFSRYYDRGDFISQRRYKGDTYAIPYAGEEVVLHWANQDQYYTKSGEAFSNYAFKLQDGRKVQFRLVAADTAKDNRKDNDKDRRFTLAEARAVTRFDGDGERCEDEIVPISEEDDGLVIRFEYRAFPKGTKQEALVAKAVAEVLEDETVKSRWDGLNERVPTTSDPRRTLLEKHLTTYTQKNTADYFIHKDLGRFLRRELDFYIKNEVMNLDDVQNAEAFAAIEKSLRMIQCLRTIAEDVVTFLSSIEDFQKRLWLKKKFVVSSEYCITLDRVPQKFHSVIAANPAQWSQWHELGLRDSGDQGSAADLEDLPHLMMDTSLFPTEVKANLLKEIDDIDSSLNGVIVQGFNFQALKLLEARYNNSIKSVYIDPPYNTDASAIDYKNGFKDSSWLALLYNSVSASSSMMSNDGIICQAIDDVEVANLRKLTEEIFGNTLGIAAVRSNPAGRSTPTGFSVAHEYAIFASKSDTVSVGRLPRSEKQAARYSEVDELGAFEWVNFRKHGGAEATRSARPRMFYPIYATEKAVRVPDMLWDDAANAWSIQETPTDLEVEVWPLSEDGRELRWKWGADSVRSHLKDFKLGADRFGRDGIYMKARMSGDGMLPVTWWEDKKYSATEYGTNLLSKMFGGVGNFSFPKSLHLVEDCLRVTGASRDAIVLDYFAGSGTTGHAVINLNKADGGSRRYILAEQGEYFDAVLKPRLQKAVFSSEWKSGRPANHNSGVSHAFKVLRLESYEDTLNNLKLMRESAQDGFLKQLEEKARDDYLIRYMLDVEARGSLLSVANFRRPFDYELNVAVDSAGAYERRKIDLVETFNYLIGLAVKSIDIQLTQGFVTVEGTLPTGERTLVLWRDCDQVDYEKLARLCDKLAINPSDTEYDVVYINGDHNIPSVVTSSADEGEVTKVLKLRQIEPAFLEAMFDVSDV